MSFKDPAAGGDQLPLADLLGSLLLFAVRGIKRDILTKFGTSDAAEVDVVVLDGPKKGATYDNALVFPRVLRASLEGSVGEMVIGRLDKGVAKAGQSPPWVLNIATAEDKATGERYLAHVAAQGGATAAQPAPAPAPAPAAPDQDSPW